MPPSSVFPLLLVPHLSSSYLPFVTLRSNSSRNRTNTYKTALPAIRWFLGGWVDAFAGCSKCPRCYLNTHLAAGLLNSCSEHESEHYSLRHGGACLALDFPLVWSGWLPEAVSQDPSGGAVDTEIAAFTSMTYISPLRSLRWRRTDAVGVSALLGARKCLNILLQLLVVCEVSSGLR